MNLHTYLETTPEELQKYVNEGLVDVADHDVFPLSMLTYGRKATYDNVWDHITRRCRGLIFNINTLEIVARPFEKFFNLGTAGMPETDPSTWAGSAPDDILFGNPEVWEKMDGFLATLYSYNGKSYIASKGSFHSPHAKWASSQVSKNWQWPVGYTPVFEGITSSLRIVVDYGKREGLTLLALINIETGEELDAGLLREWAALNALKTPDLYPISLEDARADSLKECVKNFEGYVLIWRIPGQTPFRLKVKYLDYLRLHRMVCGVSAKAIWRNLSGHSEAYSGDLQEWLDKSTPWFAEYVKKWKRALDTKFNELQHDADMCYKVAQGVLNEQYKITGILPVRKDWALIFTRPEFKKSAPILFAMMDGKDTAPVIWKLVKPLIKDSKPMVDVTRI